MTVEAPAPRVEAEGLDPAELLQTSRFQADSRRFSDITRPYVATDGIEADLSQNLRESRLMVNANRVTNGRWLVVKVNPFFKPGGLIVGGRGPDGTPQPRARRIGCRHRDFGAARAPGVAESRRTRPPGLLAPILAMIGSICP